jgi:peptidoglycan/xylan/chitin deacetylase (PgdA/CDA1 family)
MDFNATYRWDVRPQLPRRPEWFKAWPNGSKMALQIIILHEWETMPWHRSRPMPANSHFKFDFMSLGSREYGARHGIYRLMDVVERHGLRATVMTNGLTAELFPDSVRAIADRGHEVVAHQWDQAVFPPMFRSRDEERETLRKTKDILARVSGQPIDGYMSPGPRPTGDTLELLIELGYRWTCDYVDSDFPYFIPIGSKRLVAVPYATPGCIDFDLLGYPLPDRLAHMKYMFDATCNEARCHPMMFAYAVHTHWGGTTGMAQMLEDFLVHAGKRAHLWHPLGSDIARFWENAQPA